MHKNLRSQHGLLGLTVLACFVSLLSIHDLLLLPRQATLYVIVTWTSPVIYVFYSHPFFFLCIELSYSFMLFCRIS